MQAIHRSILWLFVLTGMAGCGGSQEEAPERAEPPPVEETAFGDMVGTADKAHGVQDTTMQRKKDLDRALEEGEGR